MTREWKPGQHVNSKCPTCGDKASREVYDIGSGPELCCAVCDWCWGANGQPLRPVTYRDVVEAVGFDPLAERT